MWSCTWWHSKSIILPKLFQAAILLQDWLVLSKGWLCVKRYTVSTCIISQIFKPIHQRCSAYTEQSKVHASTTISLLSLSLYFSLSSSFIPGSFPSSKDSFLTTFSLGVLPSLSCYYPFSTGRCQRGKSPPACLCQSSCLHPYHCPPASLSSLVSSATCSPFCPSWSLLPADRKSVV